MELTTRDDHKIEPTGRNNLPAVLFFIGGLTYDKRMKIYTGKWTKKLMLRFHTNIRMTEIRVLVEHLKRR